MKALTRKEVIEAYETDDHKFYCPTCLMGLEEIKVSDEEKLTCFSGTCEFSERYYDLQGNEVQL